MLRFHSSVRAPAAFVLLVCLLLTACAPPASNAPPATASAAPPAATDAAGASASTTSGGVSSAVRVAGLVDAPATLTLTELRAFSRTEVTTEAQTGSGPLGRHDYAGALLYDVVQKSGPKFDASRKNDALRKSVVVTGSDGYSAAFAWGEIDPRFAGKRIVVAYEQDGKPLAERDGPVRVIVPGDVFAGRYVSNVVNVEVRDVGTVAAPGERKPSSTFALAGLVASPSEVTADSLATMPQSEVRVDTRDAQGNVTGSATYRGGRKNDILRVGVLGIATDGYASLVTGGEVDAKYGNIPALIALAKDGAPLSPADGFARIVVPGDVAAGRFVSNLVRMEVVRLD